MSKTFHDKDFVDLKNSKERDRMYSKFDEKQRMFFHSIQDNLFSFCEASAGSGKTTIAAASMLDLLANGKIDKIIYIRTPDDRAQSIGYYPGDIMDKTELYYKPFKQALNTLGLQSEAIELLETQEQIETTLDINLRGITIARSGVIVDEVQNMPFYTLKLIFSRITDDSHVAVIGDGKQCDQKMRTRDYKRFCEYLANTPMGNKCELTSNYRGKFSRLAEEFSLD